VKEAPAVGSRADIPAITEALGGLGVHVVPAGSPEVATMRGFRDALRADPRLRREYAALKQRIVDSGRVDPVAFTKAKHDWIVAALDQLGLGRHRPYRLYEDNPSLDSSHRLAS
jgi:hypothetical protein